MGPRRSARADAASDSRPLSFAHFSPFTANSVFGMPLPRYAAHRVAIVARFVSDW
jgi:hypothetical protein